MTKTDAGEPSGDGTSSNLSVPQTDKAVGFDSDEKKSGTQPAPVTHPAAAASITAPHSVSENNDSNAPPTTTVTNATATVALWPRPATGSTPPEIHHIILAPAGAIVEAKPKRGRGQRGPDRKPRHRRKPTAEELVRMRKKREETQRLRLHADASKKDAKRKKSRKKKGASSSRSQPSLPQPLPTMATPQLIMPNMTLPTMGMPVSIATLPPGVAPAVPNALLAALGGAPAAKMKKAAFTWAQASWPPAVTAPRQQMIASAASHSTNESLRLGSTTTPSSERATSSNSLVVAPKAKEDATRAASVPSLSLSEALQRRTAANRALRKAELAAERAETALREAEAEVERKRERRAAAEAEALKKRRKAREGGPATPQPRVRWRQKPVEEIHPQWMKKYEQLKKYAEETGGCSFHGVSKYDKTEMARLYDWVLRQRMTYRLKNEALELASAPEGSGDNSQSINKRAIMANRETEESLESLSARREKAVRVMTPDKIALLEAIPGWEWSRVNPNAWRDKFDSLVRYKAEHGTCVVPMTLDSRGRPDELYNWVQMQRSNYRRMQEGRKKHCLNVERVRLLESLGFVWEVRSDSWNRYFDELLKFKRKHGTCHVPKRHKQSGYSLGSWCQRHRRYYNDIKEGKQDPKTSSLTPERIKLLDSCGFPWVAAPLRFKSDAKADVVHEDYEWGDADLDDA